MAAWRVASKGWKLGHLKVLHLVDPLVQTKVALKVASWGCWSGLLTGYWMAALSADLRVAR